MNQCNLFLDWILTLLIEKIWMWTVLLNIILSILNILCDSDTVLMQENNLILPRDKVKYSTMKYCDVCNLLSNPLKNKVKETDKANSGKCKRWRLVKFLCKFYSSLYYSFDFPTGWKIFIIKSWGRRHLVWTAVIQDF